MLRRSRPRSVQPCPPDVWCAKATNLLMLIALQTMNFWLCTASGESSETFEGTTEKPFYGLSQGSGSVPMSYLATSTQGLEAYKQRNFHSTLKSAITDCFLLLAATIFVDDTDQLHLSGKVNQRNSSCSISKMQSRSGIY